MARTAHPPSADLITLDEAADLLGCSRITIRRRVSDGTLAAYRMGRLVRLDREQVLKSLTRIPAAF